MPITILVKSLPNCQELVHISVHKCRLALSSKAISCEVSSNTFHYNQLQAYALAIIKVNNW